MKEQKIQEKFRRCDGEKYGAGVCGRKNRVCIDSGMGSSGQWDNVN